VILRILLAVTLAFGLVACGKKAASVSPPDPKTSAYPRGYPST
jgi:predicted small lipoprotein YifL